MPRQFIDRNEPRFNNGVPLESGEMPHGLLKTPQVVLDLVAQEKAHLPLMDAEAEKRMRDQWTLDYYFDGQEVAYRVTPQGIEVLAVGLDEIAEFTNGKTQKELATFITGQI